MAALKKGVQATLVRLGRKPKKHQTDNSTAATHRLDTGKREFNDDYVELMKHLGMEPRTIQVGKKEQNGDIEAGNGGLRVRGRFRIVPSPVRRANRDRDVPSALDHPQRKPEVRAGHHDRRGLRPQPSPDPSFHGPVVVRPAEPVDEEVAHAEADQAGHEVRAGQKLRRAEPFIEPAGHVVVVGVHSAAVVADAPERKLHVVVADEERPDTRLRNAVDGLVVRAGASRRITRHLAKQGPRERRLAGRNREPRVR